MSRGQRNGFFLRPTLLLILLLVGSLWPTSAFAEEPTFAVKVKFGTDIDATYSVAVGDMDGDGDLDIVTGNAGAQNVVYLNSGDSNFSISSRNFGPGNDATTAVAVGDMDGDGDLDIVVGNNQAPNVVYLNDGTGRFLTPGLAFGNSSDVTTSLALGDMDGDGDLDAVVGNNEQLNRVYLNDGTGLVARGPNFGTGGNATHSVAVGDMDGDKDLDIVVGNNGQNAVYLSDGKVMNFGSNIRNFGTGSDNTQSVALGDVDQDGDLDIVAGNWRLSTTGQDEPNVVYLNDGSGTFATPGRVIGTTPGPTYSVSLGDMDGDGDLDIVTGNWFAQNWIHLNDGNGNYTSPSLNFGTGNDATNTAVVSDMDGDGDLDIVVSNHGQQNAVYLSDGAGYFATAGQNFGTDSSQFSAVAVGDMNGDNKLDIVASSYGWQNFIYLNDGAGNFAAPGQKFGTGSDATASIAVGDLNGDGDLDIVVGNLGAYNKVYFNDGSGNFTAPGLNFGTGSDRPHSVALGDVDGDGDLDIVTGNQPLYDKDKQEYVGDGRNVVYFNDGTGKFAFPGHYFGEDTDLTTSVAVGDMNGDGYLDIVVGNEPEIVPGTFPTEYDGGENLVYFNDGEGNFDSADEETESFGTETDFTADVALADMDGDGDLDIVTGNSRQQNAVYFNDGVGEFAFPGRDFGTGADTTSSVAVGDMDGDGDFDIIIGNNVPFLSTKEGQNGVYLNDGLGNFAPQGRLFGIDSDDTASVALGDMDADGDLDIVTANTGQSAVFLNPRRPSTGLPHTQPWISLRRPGPVGDADFYSTPAIIDTTTIPLAYTAYDPEGDLIGHLRAFYSPNGGGQWFPTVGTLDTETTRLTTSAQGVSHIFTWDTFASGFFGQADSVVVRLEAYTQPFSTTVSSVGTYRYTKSSSGPFQWPYASATTFPFRVRGMQVQVVENAVGVADALVYRMRANQTGGEAMAGENGDPFFTDSQGYLGGRGRLEIGDQLVALRPVTGTNSYTLYHTSASVTLTGLDAFPVATPGVQELVVSSQRPLILFKLSVSLEWDARKDTGYLTQLQIDIQRASELLYDATNGQAALGEVTIYHAKTQWEQADLRIHATNRLRPHALIGGSVDTITGANLTNPDVSLAFAPGHIEMPATWNRFGESSGSLGEDWPRALAHEFGHYYFFLLEDYLGIDDAGLPAAVTRCPGLMGNVYLDENSEFHPTLSWGDSGTYDCHSTLQHQTLGRSDWDTITAFYPWLHAPGQTYAAQNQGPGTLPLAVTKIRYIEPTAAPSTLDVPAYFLTKADGSRYLASSSARAFRFHGGNLTDLGEPRQDRLQAWGASVGGNDRVCVFDLDPKSPALGCASVQNGISQLKISVQPEWLPDIILSPVSTNTLSLAVANVPPGAKLRARVYGADRPVTTTLPAEIALVYDASLASYSTTLPVYLDARLHLWDANNLSHELVTDFTLSGAPTIDLAAETELRFGRNASYTEEGVTKPIAEGTALQIGNGTALQIGNGTAEVLGDGAALQIGNGTALQIGNGTTFVLGDGAALQIGNGTALQIGNGTALLIGNGTALLIGNGTALQIGNGTALQIGNGTAQLLADGNGPVLSSDGQVILYVDSLGFAPGQYYTLQPATRVANPPGWATVVGQPYRLAQSPDAPAIAGSSLSFRYLGRDVPPGEENFLKIFFYDESKGEWIPLETTLDTIQNSAAALAQGPGLYVLMSTIPVVLPAAGWNLFAYPVQGSRPITEALDSIGDKYTAVYGFESADVVDPWRFFSPDPNVPGVLDSLHRLEFGRGYWISVTHPITLYLKGAGGEIRLADPRQTATFPQPPATLFGPVLAGEGMSAPGGTPVQAWVGESLCGAGATVGSGANALFGLHVADASQLTGCGQTGRTVTFRVGGVVAESRWAWQGSGIHRLSLVLGTESKRLLLPQIRNEK